jgi:uncharacterized protein (TIGR02118 family)
VIHQLIMASPKPGMSTEEFQRYWLENHAVNYASKIPQIKKYLIDTVIPFGDGQPQWQGVAEIWLNAEDEIASLQSPEFLNGARADEPNWAAFWLTVALDTESREVVTGPAKSGPDAVKLIVLVKRKNGLSLEEFREHTAGPQADLAGKVPGLRRYLQCFTTDALYAVGEAVLDAAHMLWFDDAEALRSALGSVEFGALADDIHSVVEPRYVHRLVTREHWIIGPLSR